MPIPDLSSAKLLARWYFFRHGQKNKAGNVTPFGLDQVAATADAHLKGIAFDGAYCSDLPRTRASVEHALRQIGHAPIEICPHVAFHVRESLSDVDLMKELGRLEDEIGTTATAKEWSERWVLGFERVKSYLRAGMTDVYLWHLHGGNERAEPFNLLVGYHGPFAGFLAENSEDVGPIDTGDVILYEMYATPLGEGDYIYYKATHLKCPLPSPK